MICSFCSYQHDNEGDRYGCPNCNGEGLDKMKNTKFWATEDLLIEEQRLVTLINRMSKYRFRKDAKYSACHSLQCVQSEITRRELRSMDQEVTA